ncbi:MAG: hypothetical protein A4E67_00181 [Syntrophaceae bacterium PtaB.Bin038]|nr:MAG: hypothetical protein A4E67_00181 [Syntrophaceae bacterium PtaB.Bin038]
MGNPAFLRASTICSIVTFSSSNVTVAIWVYSLTSAFSVFTTFVRVQLTLSRVKGHEQSGSVSWTTLSLAMADEAPIRIERTTVISKSMRDLDLMDKPPFQSKTILNTPGAKIHRKDAPGTRGRRRDGALRRDRFGPPLRRAASPCGPRPRRRLSGAVRRPSGPVPAACFPIRPQSGRRRAIPSVHGLRRRGSRACRARWPWR